VSSVIQSSTRCFRQPSLGARQSTECLSPDDSLGNAGGDGARSRTMASRSLGSLCPRCVPRRLHPAARTANHRLHLVRSARGDRCLPALPSIPHNCGRSVNRNPAQSGAKRADLEELSDVPLPAYVIGSASCRTPADCGCAFIAPRCRTRTRFSSVLPVSALGAACSRASNWAAERRPDRRSAS
jgi:hypothetical protein